MIKKGRNEVIVGMFVIVGFIILTLTLFFISGVYLFRPGYKMDVLYQYVSILDKGAPVRMAGVRVGEVDGVQLEHDSESGQARVRVRLFIEKGIDVRENYVFYIRGTHVLSEPHIEISPMPGNAPVLKKGAVVEGFNPVPLEDLIQKAHDIAAQIDAILENLSRAVGDEQSQTALKTIFVNVASLTESINQILDGREENVQQAILNIESSTGSLSSILDHMQSGEGTAGKLLMEDEIYQDLRELVQDIKKHPWKLLKKDGGDKKFLGVF